MSDSAWGTVPADDVQRLIAQQAASAKRVAELEAEVEAWVRIAKVLLVRVQSGGPSNFAHLAAIYLGDDTDLFRRRVSA